VNYYIAPFTFRFATNLIEVDVGSTDIDCATFYSAIKLAQASEVGIIYDKIGEGSGLTTLGPGVQVGITVELLGNWQLKFPAGNYVARIAGGNLVGGPGGDPIAYTAGVQTLLIQSANATVVTTSGSIPTPVEIADTVLKRSTVNIEASATGDSLSLRSLYGLIAQGVHNTQVSGATLTVTKSDDTTVLGTRTVTTDSTAEPIVGIDSD
jgi:hypothetical protein